MRRLAAALWLALAGPALAQDQAEPAARQAAGMFDAAEQALRAAEGATDRIAALSTTVQAYEFGLAALRAGMRNSEQESAVLRAVLQAEETRLSHLLSALVSIRAAPEPRLLLHPSGPRDTIRAGILATEMTPALLAEVQALRLRLDELSGVRAEQEAARAELQRGLDGAREARLALGRAVDERTDLPQRFVDDPAALQALAEGVTTLQAFADSLASAERQDRLRPRPRAFAASQGRLVPPVIGRVIREAGEADAAGIARPGVLIRTAPRALVKTPWQATIRYQGPLLDYKNVMVLEPAQGFLMVLAGLSTVYGQTGDVLPKGAPVGLMGGNDGDGSDLLSPAVESGGQDETETLYLELRQDDVPVDPAAWFAFVAR